MTESDTEYAEFQHKGNHTVYLEKDSLVIEPASDDINADWIALADDWDEDRGSAQPVRTNNNRHPSVQDVDRRFVWDFQWTSLEDKKPYLRKRNYSVSHLLDE